MGEINALNWSNISSVAVCYRRTREDFLKNSIVRILWTQNKLVFNMGLYELEFECDYIGMNWIWDYISGYELDPLVF